jgi:hypothetical protein
MSTDETGAISLPQFRQEYLKLSDEGGQALFASTGKDDLKTSLDRLAVIADDSKRVMKIAQPTGTGKLVGYIAGGDILVHGLNPHALLPILSGAVASNIVARALARPVTTKALADTGKAAIRAVESPTLANSSNYQMRNLARLLGAGVLGNNAPQPQAFAAPAATPS